MDQIITGLQDQPICQKKATEKFTMLQVTMYMYFDLEHSIREKNNSRLLYKYIKPMVVCVTVLNVQHCLSPRLTIFSWSSDISQHFSKLFTFQSSDAEFCLPGSAHTDKKDASHHSPSVSEGNLPNLTSHAYSHHRSHIAISLSLHLLYEFSRMFWASKTIAWLKHCYKFRITLCSRGAAL